jgi:hypothetical protein
VLKARRVLIELRDWVLFGYVKVRSRNISAVSVPCKSGSPLTIARTSESGCAIADESASPTGPIDANAVSKQYSRSSDGRDGAGLLTKVRYSMCRYSTQVGGFTSGWMGYLPKGQSHSTEAVR